MKFQCLVLLSSNKMLTPAGSGSENPKEFVAKKRLGETRNEFDERNLSWHWDR